MNEFVRSATDGDFDVLRALVLRTEKNAVDATEFGAVVPVAVAFGVKLESFSKALILCEIPDPRLTFFGIGLGACWLMRFKYAAPAETDLGASLRGFDTLGISSILESEASFGGFEKARENLPFSTCLIGLGKTGLMGDFETEIGFASWKTAD